MLTISWDADREMFKWSGWLGDELVFGYADTQTRCREAWRSLTEPRRPIGEPTRRVPDTVDAGLGRVYVLWEARQDRSAARP